MEITLEEIIQVNQTFGGRLRSDSSLRFAESHVRGIKSRYRIAAIWARAIIIDHPFTDANKRTALYTIERTAGLNDAERMAEIIARIAYNNVIDLNKIMEMIKNANRQ